MTARVLRFVLPPGPLVSEGTAWILTTVLDAGDRFTLVSMMTSIASEGSMHARQPQLHMCQCIECFDPDADADADRVAQKVEALRSEFLGVFAAA